MSIYMHGSDNHIFSQHLQIQENDVTYASCSFEAIINEAMSQLGHFKWEYADPFLTSEGIQEKNIVTSRRRYEPLLIVVSIPFERSCEVRKSALVNTLHYISDIRAYEMNDLYFSEYVVRSWEVLGI